VAAKKRRVVWNNSDCRAAECCRPPGTSSWVQCDGCQGWYHQVCLHLAEGDLQEDRDYFCPNCIEEKQQEFERVREKIVERIVELGSRQKEFAGYTIDRDMFKNPKSANPFNYSKDFPPTLKDLISRVRGIHRTLADFKYDYKLMCSRMMEELLEDYEARVQMIEWDLDEICEEVLKEEAVVPAASHTEDPGTEEVGGCEECGDGLDAGQTYQCKRGHRVCPACRNSNRGLVCPVCLASHGDRKRLVLQRTDSPLKPVILSVWSCSEQQDQEEEEEDRIPQVNLSSVLSDDRLGGNLLTLIDNSVLTDSSYQAADRPEKREREELSGLLESKKGELYSLVTGCNDQTRILEVNSELVQLRRLEQQQPVRQEENSHTLQVGHNGEVLVAPLLPDQQTALNLVQSTLCQADTQASSAANNNVFLYRN